VGVRVQPPVEVVVVHVIPAQDTTLISPADLAPLRGRLVQGCHASIAAYGLHSVHSLRGSGDSEHPSDTPPAENGALPVTSPLCELVSQDLDVLLVLERLARQVAHALVHRLDRRVALSHTNPNTSLSTPIPVALP
jgi:hypothetical protein